MIKRTLYFGNPGYLHLKNDQLEWEAVEKAAYATVPVEDIGLVLIDHARITVSHGLMVALLSNNAVVVHCNEKHMPAGIFVANEANTRYSEVVKSQLEASLPIKKNLWQQVIKAKIRNQAYVIRYTGQNSDRLYYLADKVMSGDPNNVEAQAASWYFSKIFSENSRFKRRREGEPPNHLLNYGYAILRAIVARGLTGSGLLGVLGIHHRNKYNAWCLADDIMEPYRPWVDKLVLEVCSEYDEIPEELTPELKRTLLGIPTLDTEIDGQNSPLMIAVNRTTASLAKVFLGETKKMLLPNF